MVLLRALSRRAKPVLVLKNNEYYVVNIGHGALRLCAVGAHDTLKTPVDVVGVVLHPFGSVKIGTDWDRHYVGPVTYDIVFQHLSPFGDSGAYTVELQALRTPGHFDIRAY